MEADRVILNPGYYSGYAGLVVWVIGTEISRRVPCRYTISRTQRGTLTARFEPNVQIVAERRGFAVARVFLRAQGRAWSFETEIPRLYMPHDTLNIVG